MHENLNAKNLNELSERELRQSIRRLQAEVLSFRKQSNYSNAIDVEVEICYLQRELELRSRFSNKERNRNTNNKEPQIQFETEV
jgi:hypothetical protein